MNDVVRVLLASDLDGTVIPRPSAACADPRWHAPALRLFQRLSERSDVALALISGRPLRDLHRWSQGVRCYRAGSFGAEIDDPAGRPLVRLDGVRARIPSTLRAAALRADLIIERKPHGYALRGNVARASAHEILAKFSTWAIRHDLHLLHLRDAVEAVPRGVEKHIALELLTDVTQAALVIYAGDDTPDVLAADWAGTRGYGFCLSRREPGAIRTIPSLWRRIRALCVAAGVDREARSRSRGTTGRPELRTREERD